MTSIMQRVAAYCGLRLSYYITAGLLTLIFFCLVPTEYRTATPLYILLMLAVLPSLVSAIFYPHKKEKRENDSAFPLFCKKYHYNLIMHKSMNIAYLLLFILFAAWHISYLHTETAAIIEYLPVLTASLSLLIRIFGVIGYRLYFHFFPLRAMR